MKQYRENETFVSTVDTTVGKSAQNIKNNEKGKVREAGDTLLSTVDKSVSKPLNIQKENAEAGVVSIGTMARAG